ncbi:MAG: pantoate--beta-alanine ligase [Ginsengibacter sp.]
MIIFKQAKDLTNFLQKQEKIRSTVGFVPTMGALHDGHLSLLKESKKNAKITVVSIFINPTQFNNKEDLEKYPTPLSKDILLLEESGCDILFLPDETEIYPDETSKQKHFELGYLENILEGKFRPGHFQGVCLVVERLLNIVDPDFILLGQKDFQQCLVIERLIKMMEKKINVIICPILRETTGLAMSSRNLRLSEEDRTLASELHQALVFIKNNLKSSKFSLLKNEAIRKLESENFKIEYLELASKNNLEILSETKSEENQIILIAAYLSNIRLIDNVLITG